MNGPEPRAPTFAEATRIWAKIGLLSFGGPAGQIALMHRLVVDERKWISEARFLHALNYCFLLPGPEAQQLATYVGWLLHGTWGGIIAGTLFVLPGFVVIVALSAFYATFQDTAWLGIAFFGLKAAVLAIVIQALVKLGSRALGNQVKLGLAAAAFLAIYAFDVPFPLIVLAAAMIGYGVAKSRPELLIAGGHGGGGEEGDTHEPELRHVDPTPARALRVTLTWGALWLAPLLLIGAFAGVPNVFTDIFQFFSKMAVVTFGGAYAVLAYVAQQAVETYGWLKPGEMLDGLAMAETTPGPLVMILTYVGFIAGFRDTLGLSPLGAGFLGGALTTWVTFVPCFLWIFLGAPYVERLRENQVLAGALGAITAAIVGVILNLAVWFAVHVLFRDVMTLDLGPLSPAWPVWETIDVRAAAVSVLAAVAIFKLKWGVITTLALSGVLGAFLQWLM